MPARHQPSSVNFLAYKFFIVAVADGFGTTNDRALAGLLPMLAAQLPLDTCITFYLCNPDECRQFRADQKLDGLSAPLLFLTEEYPLSGNVPTQRAVIELGRLPTEDDVKRVIAAIVEQAYSPQFIEKARKGEIIRKIERALGRYGGLIRDCLSLAGFT